MKFKAIVIDDEKLAIQRLVRLLKMHTNDIDIIDTAQNGDEALKKISALKPDLIFLDIQMPEMTGFELIEKLDQMPLIIFCTAYDKYALQAFETNSVDYLLKPVEPERLASSIVKLKRLTSGDTENLHERIASILSGIQKPMTYRIKVSVGDSIFFLNTDDIFFFQSRDKYVEVHTFDKVYLLSKTLKELESELPANDFIRIHRSSIVNLNHVEKAVRWFGGKHKVRMKNKDTTELEVSRNAKGRLGIS